MEMSFGSRLKHAWNAFFNKDPPIITKMLELAILIVRIDRD